MEAKVRETKNRCLVSFFVSLLEVKKIVCVYIIDTNVYSAEYNLALSKEKFAQAIYNSDITVTEENWNEFRFVFEEIVRYIELSGR